MQSVEQKKKEIPSIDNQVNNNSKDWTLIIQPRRSLFDLNLREIWRYRDLLVLFVWRDFIAKYKQTILGPLWHFIQPLLTTIVFTIVFGNIAGISTDGLPKMLFYMAGITPWNYFADCWSVTGNTFKANAQVFGKVYFPRVIMPLSIVISNLIKFGIQSVMFMGFYLYFVLQGTDIHPTEAILLLPVLLLIMAGLGLGLGMIVSALTTKYRDLSFLLSFAVRLMMYGTPVIFPLSEIPPQYKTLILANPMSAVIETFRYATLGIGQFSWPMLAYSFGFMVVVLILGLLIFNKTEQNFMDTV